MKPQALVLFVLAFALGFALVFALDLALARLELANP